MKKLFILSLFTIGSLSCENKSTGTKEKTDTYSDPCAEYDATDLEMLGLLKEVRDKRRGNQIFLQRFNDSQGYWIQYKDRHLRALYPEDWDRHYRKSFGKEVFNSCKCKELSRLTRARIEELKMYLNGGPSDQRECPSSWN